MPSLLVRLADPEAQSQNADCAEARFAQIRLQAFVDFPSAASLILHPKFPAIPLEAKLQ